MTVERNSPDTTRPSEESRTEKRKRVPRTWPLFTAGGIAMSAACFATTSYLIDLYPFYEKPGWVIALIEGLPFLPLALVLVFLLRAAITRRFELWAAYCIGASLPWIWLLAEVLFGPWGGLDSADF